VTLVSKFHCLSETVFLGHIRQNPHAIYCDYWLRSDKTEPKVFYDALDVVCCLGSSFLWLIQQRRVSQLHGSREQPVNARLVHATNIWRGGPKQRRSSRRKKGIARYLSRFICRATLSFLTVCNWRSPYSGRTKPPEPEKDLKNLRGKRSDNNLQPPNRISILDLALCRAISFITG
jgi:hypothetical protein